jgi:hypothetical protein
MAAFSGSRLSTNRKQGNLDSRNRSILLKNPLRKP